MSDSITWHSGIGYCLALCLATLVVGCIDISPAQPSPLDSIPRPGNRIFFTAKYADGSSGVDWCEADGGRRQSLLRASWRLASQPKAGRFAAIRFDSLTTPEYYRTACVFEVATRKQMNMSGMAFTDLRNLSLSLEGDKLLTCVREGILLIANVDGTLTQGLSIDADIETPPLYSPDGKLIAYVNVDLQHRRAAAPTLSLLNTSAADGVLFDTVDRELGVDFAWSPDSRKLVYTDRHLTRRSDLVIVNIDGTGRRTISNGVDNDFRPQWSPDGSRIAFTTGTPDGPTEIAVINADGSGRRNLTSTPGVNEDFVQWSPDGSRLLYRTIGPASTLRVVDLATGISRTIVDSIDGPAFWDYSLQ